MKSIIKKILEFIILLFPLKNIIIFESYPTYSDNTKKVFDELLARGYNKKYKLVWLHLYEECADEQKEMLKDIHNVKIVSLGDRKHYYYLYFAKAIIVCNSFLQKKRNNQYYCDLAHGCALKNAVGYSLPPMCEDADVMTISEYMAPFDAHNLSHNPECMKALGYARNDDLFNNVDLKKIFGSHNFSKVIYWLPTYRQNRWGDPFHSDISMPILYTENEAKQLNACARDNDVLMVVKVHPAQDLSKIQEFNLSNVIFIKNEFFFDKDFTNYQLLGSSDAMISDYSSVYYDYLLCDKPIGLCFDDFEEYKKREGFTMDPDVILKGGEKLYNIDDLCAFVKSVANGEDKLYTERNEIKNLVHDHTDNQSTKRIVDYLETKI